MLEILAPGNPNQGINVLSFIELNSVQPSTVGQSYCLGTIERYWTRHPPRSIQIPYTSQGHMWSLGIEWLGKWSMMCIACYENPVGIAYESCQAPWMNHSKQNPKLWNTLPRLVQQLIGPQWDERTCYCAPQRAYALQGTDKESGTLVQWAPFRWASLKTFGTSSDEIWKFLEEVGRSDYSET